MITGTQFRFFATGLRSVVLFASKNILFNVFSRFKMKLRVRLGRRSERLEVSDEESAKQLKKEIAERFR